MKIKEMGRWPAALSVGVLLLAVLAGCGSSSKSTTSEGNGDAVDRAFVRQMIPHHESAVEMAGIAARRAQHAQITTLAANITTAQNREISELKQIARHLGVTPGAMSMSGHMNHSSGNMDTDAHTLGIATDAMGMSMDMTTPGTAKPFDRAFIDMMTPHHRGAVLMAKAELARGQNPKLQTIARGIITGQTKELAEMKAWRMRWYGAGPPGAAAMG